MKLMVLSIAGVFAASALTPVPAEAQRHGWHGDRGWHGGPGWRGNRGWRGRRLGRVPRRNGYGYGYRHRPRARQVCNTVRGYYGPVRRCRTVWR